jgi:hypothetical protein
VLGFETFAAWWEARVQPIMRALSMRPSKDLALEAADRIRDEETLLPPAQRRREQEIADLVGATRDELRDRTGRSTSKGIPPKNDLASAPTDPLNDIPDEAKAAIKARLDQTSGSGDASPAAGSGENTPIDRSEPQGAAGVADDPSRAGDGEGRSEVDRPGSAGPGEAEDGGSPSAADGSRPSATQTGSEVLPPKPPTGSVNGRGRAGAGVSQPVPVPPGTAVVGPLEELAEKYEALDVDVLGPLLTSEDLAGIDRNLNRVVAIVELLTRWYERAQA